MKPIIGVTTSMSDEKTIALSINNTLAVQQAGGIPMLLPNVTNEQDIQQMVKRIDGLLLTGGGDIDPTLFGEEPHRKLGNIVPERDEFEIVLSKTCLKLDVPILAICRGCQILNIAAGGDMYQDIYDQIDRPLLQHTQNAPTSHRSHFVHIERQSKLFNIAGTEKMKVNSFHHQAVRDMARHFIVTARSSDDIIEAFESTKHRFVVGVQWHPECTIYSEDGLSLPLFESFIDAANNN